MFRYIEIPLLPVNQCGLSFIMYIFSSSSVFVKQFDVQIDRDSSIVCESMWVIIYLVDFFLLSSFCESMWVIIYLVYFFFLLSFC